MAGIGVALGALAAAAAGVYQESGYAGFAGLGRSPGRRRRRKRGPNVGSARYLSNLPAALREAAKNDSKALQDQLKTAREQAWAEFYAKYPGAIPLEQRKIDRVVARFLMGQEEASVTPYVQSVSDGGTGTRLIVQGREVAARPNAFARFVKVCPGDFGTGKVDRAAANSVLRMLQAGLRATDRQGKVFLAPTGHQGRVVAPPSCMLVEVNEKVRREANRYAFNTRSVMPINPAGGGAFVPSAASSSSGGPSAAWMADMEARARRASADFEDFETAGPTAAEEARMRNLFNGMRRR